MHTLNREPAFYDVGQQICYASERQAIPVCTSLKQIRREQKLSSRWRASFENQSPKFAEYVKVAEIKYGYVKVRLP